MKPIKLLIYTTIIFLNIGNRYAFGNETALKIAASSSIEAQITALVLEITIIKKQYNLKSDSLFMELSKSNHNLKEAKNDSQKLHWLLKKDELKEMIAQLEWNEKTDISKIRYIKGLQIIKLLYEKTLSLDHHFSTVNTFGEINKISNPNYYPEFAEMKELIRSKKDSKSGFDLSQVLGNNIYTSVAHSFISLFTNTNTSKEEKESSLSEVECILDFTLRMHNDLNTIYFETVFLQKSNENIIQELQQLFVDFTKPIAYENSLHNCRNSDDWDAVRENLNVYLQKLDTVMNDESQWRKARKMQINLEFPIDRLLQFIAQYNAFIDEGAKFYEKFGIMLSSYENEQLCSNKIPIEYKALKESIAIAIEKFNTTYKPVEINGSKMKEILYGINEYD
jgi:hypothetical protein